MGLTSMNTRMTRLEFSELIIKRTRKEREPKERRRADIVLEFINN